MFSIINIIIIILIFLFLYLTFFNKSNTNLNKNNEELLNEKKNTISVKKKKIKKKDKKIIKKKINLEQIIEAYDSQNTSFINSKSLQNNNKFNYNENFTDDSSSIDKNNFDNILHKFIKANKFLGEKKGYVFKMGENGLGYYLDYYKKLIDHNNVHIYS
jgi:hypothetical protein